MKKLGLMALLSLLPLFGFSQIEKDTLKTNNTKEIYIPKIKESKTSEFYDINLNKKTQYTIPINKKMNFFTEYFTPTQNYLKPEQIKTPKFKAGLKIKF